MRNRKALVSLCLTIFASFLCLTYVTASGFYAVAAPQPAGTPAPTATGLPSPAPAPTATPVPLAALFSVQPRQILSRFLNSALILAAGFVLAWLLQKLVFRALSRVHREIQIFVSRLTYIAVLVVAILWVLAAFNVNAATLATILGSLGLALSLSSQDLFKNLVAGVYILLERPFGVGDEVTVSGFTGQVEIVDMRTTTLRTEDGKQVIVPNTLLISQVIVRGRVARAAPEGEEADEDHGEDLKSG